MIVGGLEKLGLDPNDIKYIVISHAHGDHIGGAEILQKRFGAKVVMGGPDWDTVQSYPNRFKTMAPTKNITATDGMKLTLGDTTLSGDTAIEHVDITSYVDGLELDAGKVALGYGVTNEEKEEGYAQKNGTCHGDSLALGGLT